MSLYVLLFFILIAAIIWLVSFILEHVQTVTITWGTWGSYAINTTHLLLLFIIAFSLFYIFIWLLKSLFNIKKNLRDYQQNRKTLRARQTLTQGLIAFISGHWVESEALLLRHVNDAETPLLNYLAAAQAAHMQENYDNRDQYLKKATEKGNGAQVAIAVSQAQMQLSSQQIEQARATLVHLLELSPNHLYATQLLAKVYYQQEDWKLLIELLPKLKQQNLLKQKVHSKFEASALKGIFQLTALKKQPEALQLLWNKLPQSTQKKPQAILNYTDALLTAGDAQLAEKTILNNLNKHWDTSLVEYFGKMEHVNLDQSIQQAQNWLVQQDNSPELLFCLARLYRKNKQWEKSYPFYESGLNRMPNTECYLEFAELLTQLKDQENAMICYQKGLKYCVTKKGETLSLKSKVASK